MSDKMMMTRLMGRVNRVESVNRGLKRRLDQLDKDNAELHKRLVGEDSLKTRVMDLEARNDAYIGLLEELAGALNGIQVEEAMPPGLQAWIKKFMEGP